MSQTNRINHSDHSERERFFGAAKVVASLTMLSRVLGLLRDIFLIPIGTGLLADRFWLAFSIPNLFRRLFGEGALTAAFVPIFSETFEQKGMERARLLLANVAGLLAVFLGVILVLTWGGLWLSWVLFGGDWLRLYLLELLAMMMPFMFTVCMLALGSAALQCKGRFGYPAFAPIILNVVLIITGAWIVPKIEGTDGVKLMVLALAVVVAGLLQLFGVVVLLKRAGLAMMAITRIVPILSETKRVARLMLPMMIPLSALQVSALADRVIVLNFSGAGPDALLAPGLVRCLFVSNRLYMLPLGVLAIPIATAVFPLFSRYAARDDQPALRDATNRALRLCLFLGIPAGVGLMIIAEPIIQLLFQRGDFLPEDTQRAAMILRAYSLGMWAYFCNHILLRAFYALKRPGGPMKLAGLLMPVNVLLVLLGVHTPLKGSAVGLATALTATVNMFALAWMLHRELGELGFRRIMMSLLRIFIATTGLAAAGVGALVALQSIPLILQIAAAVFAGSGAFAVLAILMKAPELRELRKAPPPPKENAIDG